MEVAKAPPATDGHEAKPHAQPPTAAEAAAEAAFAMGEQIAQQMNALALQQQPGAAPPSTPAADDSIRIFIGDLSPATTSQSLTAYFSQFGPVLQATVKHPSQGAGERTRSFGFISVPNMEVAQAITSAPSHVIDGHRVGAPELAKHKQGERKSSKSADAAHMAGWDPSKGGPNGAAGDASGGVGRLPPEVRKIFVGGLSHSTKDSALSVRATARPTLPCPPPPSSGRSAPPPSSGRSATPRRAPSAARTFACTR